MDQAGPGRRRDDGKTRACGQNARDQEIAMNLETQNHLTVLRGMLAFELNEARTELRALLRDDPSTPPDVRPREVVDRKDEADSARADELGESTVDRLTREVAQ